MLYLFDIDGTLCERDSTALYPHVEAWLKAERPEDIALVTNQGGVGLRMWMEQNNWGNPEKFPTEEEVIARVETVAANVAEFTKGDVVYYYSFRYLSKKGNWSPMPYDIEAESYAPEWSRHYRKPNPGMLTTAMLEGGVIPSECLMVGDRPEDKEAAEACGVEFSWAKDFFVKA